MIKSMHLTPSSNKNAITVVTLAIAIGVGVYWADSIRFNESPALEASSSVRPVAWYVANIADAKAVNRACFHEKDPALTQASEDCQNAHKALNLAHIGQNYQN